MSRRQRGDHGPSTAVLIAVIGALVALAIAAAMVAALCLAANEPQVDPKPVGGWHQHGRPVTTAPPRPGRVTANAGAGR